MPKFRRGDLLRRNGDGRPRLVLRVTDEGYRYLDLYADDVWPKGDLEDSHEKVERVEFIHRNCGAAYSNYRPKDSR